MAENKKAVDILAVYTQLKAGAADVSSDLLFSTASNLVAPPFMYGTATGMAVMREAEASDLNALGTATGVSKLPVMDAATAARQVTEEIEGKGASA